MDGKSIVNFYTQPKMKKYLTSVDNPTFANTHIKLNTHSLIIGGTGSGKSNALFNFIKLSPHTFEKVIICYKDMEPIYQFLKDHLKNGTIEFYDDLKKMPRLSDIRADLEETDKILLIIDDWVNDVHKFPNVNDIFLRGRKYNITCMFLAQSYFKTPKFIRLQVSYIWLVKVSSTRDLNLILSDYSLGLNKEELAQLYKDATKNKLDFFKIDIHATEEAEKYSKNFTDFYDV
jgi:hypothetical protein